MDEVNSYYHILCLSLCFYKGNYEFCDPTPKGTSTYSEYYIFCNCGSAYTMWSSVSFSTLKFDSKTNDKNEENSFLCPLPKFVSW